MEHTNWTERKNITGKNYKSETNFYRGQNGNNGSFLLVEAFPGASKIYSEFSN